MARPVHILGICGSLRKESYNRKLLEIARGSLPPDTTLEIAGIEGIPPFNEDEEAQPAAAVRALKEKVQKADAILFATPEYNYGIPGPLKNAIDSVARPPGQNSWKGKPTAVMSASVAMLGGARATYQLRQTFVFLDMHPINRPEVFVAGADEKFDAQGNLTDEAVRKQIAALLKALADWTRRLQLPVGS